MKSLIILTLFVLASCNSTSKKTIAAPKISTPQAQEEVSPTVTRSQTKSKTSTKDLYWNEALGTQNKSGQEQTEFLAEYLNTLDENDSQEILARVEELRSKIQSFESINVLRHYSNAKRHKLKNLYLSFAKMFYHKDNMIASIVDTIEQTPYDFAQGSHAFLFLDHISQVYIQRAILDNKNSLLKLERLSKKEIDGVILDLDTALYIKQLLEDNKYAYELTGKIKRKLKAIKFKESELESNQDLIELQAYVDRLLN